MPRFNVEFAFKMDCYTRGYTIEARDHAEAESKAFQSIDEYGYLDFRKFESLGGDHRNGSWDASGGSDHEYEVHEVEETGDA